MWWQVRSFISIYCNYVTVFPLTDITVGRNLTDRERVQITLVTHQKVICKEDVEIYIWCSPTPMSMNNYISQGQCKLKYKWSEVEFCFMQYKRKYFLLTFRTPWIYIGPIKRDIVVLLDTILAEFFSPEIYFECWCWLTRKR